jgi:hypothetical protein
MLANFPVFDGRCSTISGENPAENLSLPPKHSVFGTLYGMFMLKIDENEAHGNFWVLGLEPLVVSQNRRKFGVWGAVEQ